ncbi:MAG TPA: hypothetical protein VHB50_20615 [Bryobacteraceae bacterium]|nr:hypothetical protein [Bryobacteraceae bacterium]
MNTCAVDVWTISLDVPRRVILSPEERDRAARFRFERDRIHWTHARSALRLILGKYLGITPAEIQFTLGQHGKPAVAGIEFNLSHSSGWAMIAVSRHAPVGVDLEKIREDLDIGKLLHRIGEPGLGGTTDALWHEWTRREARTKATGSSLMDLPPCDLRVIDLIAPAGFVASLALRACEPSVNYVELLAD